MTTIIAVANTKGGSGKTTLSLLLAEQFAKYGNRVAILDVDSQQTAYQWGKERLDAGRTNPFTVLSIPTDNSQELHEALKRIKEEYDYVFIDLPGKKSLIVANAIAFAHLVMIPVNIGREEVRGALKTLSFIEEQEAVLQRKIERRIIVTNTGAGAVPAAGETEAISDIADSGIMRLDRTLRNGRPLKDLFTYQMTIAEQMIEMVSSRSNARQQIERVDEDGREIATEVITVLKELANGG